MDRVLALLEANEVRRNRPALVHQLVEGVLPVGPRLSEVDGSGARGASRAVHLHALAIGLHIQLLDVRHEAHERLAVRQDRVALVAQASRIPHREQRHERGQILRRRGGLEVSVHGCCTIEELPHGVEPVLQRQRQHPHRAAHGEAAPHPIPEAEDVGVVDAKSLRLGQRGRASDDVLGDGCLVPELFDDPSLECPRIQHGLRCGEGLGDHNDERGLRAEPIEGALDVYRVDIGQELQRPARGGLGSVWVGLQGLKDELDTQVRAADADAHDVRQRLARVADEGARADLLREGLHGVEHGVDLRHDVLAVDVDHLVLRCPQGVVQHGTALGLVDLAAREETLLLTLHVHDCGELLQQAHGLLCDLLAAVI
mmetsp:Transcript_55967/g.141721  ORF Transcript_55967/g.141721 Transcript_55967/m.141721 type:complete len:370 (+) Transcript_55967:1351-2460(+)